MTETNVVPGNLKPHWPSKVSSSFGVYDMPSLPGNLPMNASIWGDTIRNALSAADHYVWAYTEKYDWWNTGWPSDPVSADWVEATVRAQAN